jgi:hypothetical protein
MGLGQRFNVNRCSNTGLSEYGNDSPVGFFCANTYGDVSEGYNHTNPIATKYFDEPTRKMTLSDAEVGVPKWTNGKQNQNYLADNRMDPGFDQAGNLFIDAWDWLSP